MYQTVFGRSALNRDDGMLFANIVSDQQSVLRNFRLGHLSGQKTKTWQKIFKRNRQFLSFIIVALDLYSNTCIVADYARKRFHCIVPDKRIMHSEGTTLIN